MLREEQKREGKLRERGEGSKRAGWPCQEGHRCAGEGNLEVWKHGISENL